MAVVYAVKTGNWSDTTVWNTGALPTSADDVYANNFTVTVNQNINVISLRNGATTGVNAGGQFAGQGNTTIVCDTIVNGSGTSTLRFLAQTGSSTVTANTIIGGSGVALDITNHSAFTITVNGNVFGSSTSTQPGLTCANSAVLNVTLNGNATAQTGVAINAQSSGLNLILNGVLLSSTLALGINGTVNSTTHSVTVTKAITPDSGVTSLSNTGKLSTYIVKEIEQGAFGQVPISGYIRLSTASGAFYKGVTTGSSTRTLSDPADIAGQVPAQTDVRFGVTYQSGAKTGSAYIPAAASVAFGVPVDNTTGTAALTPSAVWNTATSSLTTSGSIGERLKNASTVDTTGDQLAALL